MQDKKQRKQKKKSLIFFIFIFFQQTQEQQTNTKKHQEEEKKERGREDAKGVWTRQGQVPVWVWQVVSHLQVAVLRGMFSVALQVLPRDRGDRQLLLHTLSRERHQYRGDVAAAKMQKVLRMSSLQHRPFCGSRPHRLFVAWSTSQRNPSSSCFFFSF